MKTFALLDASMIVQRLEDFEEAAPQLAPEKGLRWVEWRDVAPPTITPLQKLGVPVVVVVDFGGNEIASYAWAVTNLPSEVQAVVVESRRAEKNRLVNAARADANQATFTHAGKEIACDALSRSDLDGIANYIALFDAYPPEWLGVWKAADNSYLDMATVAQFRAMYESMVTAGLNNFKQAQQRKNALAAATTIEAIDAVLPVAVPMRPHP